MMSYGSITNIQNISILNFVGVGGILRRLPVGLTGRSGQMNPNNWLNNWKPKIINETRTPTTPRTYEFQWWICRMDPPHYKMMSDRQPICSECHTPMVEMNAKAQEV